MDQHDEFVTALADAVAGSHTFPEFPAGLTVADGEALQAPLAQAAGGAAGLKAGLGDPGVQQMLGLDGPLLGYLYQPGRLTDGVTLAADPAVRAECELGLRLRADGTIAGVSPVVEIARVAFAEPSDMTGPNLAASNIGSDRYIVGDEQPWTSAPDGNVTVTRDGDEVLTAGLCEAMGGPEQALAWMLDVAERRGIELWDDMLFITGVCGPAFDLAAGTYEADFGPLGRLTFMAG